jgi:SNF family Na+-dependent transporter
MDLSGVVHSGPLLVSLFDYLDPLTYMDEDTYRAMWMGIFHTMFQGTLARVAAGICLFYSFWYGTYKQKFGIGVLFFVLTTAFAYFGSVARLFGLGAQ